MVALSIGRCSCRRVHPAPSAFSKYPLVFGTVPLSATSIIHYKLCASADIAQSMSSSSRFGCVAPPSFLLALVSTKELRSLLRCHGVMVTRRMATRVDLERALSSHVCGQLCATLVSVFDVSSVDASPTTPTAPSMEERPLPATQPDRPFPPIPLSLTAKASIIRDWCDDISPENVYESPCAVCARLALTSSLTSVKEGDLDLAPLIRPGCGVTRAERSVVARPVEIGGPILYPAAVRTVADVRILDVCPPCLDAVRRGRLPSLALANGRWIGEQPPELQGLSYVEQLIIARHRHSFCVAQVARSAQRYLAANVVVFGQPVDRLYSVLPPHRKEIAQCLAILFVGSAKPSDEDIRRTPFLVRRDVVARALRWLQLNNDLYSDVEISNANLASYEEGQPPVGIVYRPQSTSTSPESLAVYETSSDRSVGEGEVSFVVHALHAPDLARMTYEAKVALAVRHFESGNGVLAYGHC
ncbi:hypothetical protein C8Q79DRAFT_1095744 [Trametes meyenii]|nr:hypothetical protein C8Q79DRAFT_1095744 [Trametes meyenii]